MNEHQEPALHALAIEPRTARPGEIVRLRFRTPNLSASASPSATVRFLLPPELEALDEIAPRVQPVAPGADVVATLRARIATPLEDGLRLIARAALELEHEVLGTNHCTVCVRSSPVLDGPLSGVFLSLQDDQTVLVRAVVCNEGDGAASELELCVAPPAGCSRLEGEPARLALPRLEVGEHTELRFTARLDAPGDVLVADDALLRCGAGAPIALPVRERIALAPALARPELHVQSLRRGARIAIVVRNDGWAEARDVALRVMLPPPLRPREGSVQVDGIPAARRARGDAFAHLERDGATTTVALARVPARREVEVSLETSLPPGFAAASMRVTLDEHEVTAELAPAPARDLRLRVLEGPRIVEAGDTAAIVAEIVNAGDLTEVFTLRASGPELVEDDGPREVTLAAGMLTRAALAPRIRSDLPDDARLTVTLRAEIAGEARASATCAIAVRDRACLVMLACPQRGDGGIAYALRNAGATTARDVRAWFDQTAYVLEPLSPGAEAMLVVAEPDARRGGSLCVAGREVLALPAFGSGEAATVRGALEAPQDVVAGAAFVVRARVSAPTGVERLALRASIVAGAAYVAGSTQLDGVALLDRLGDSPLAAEGLVLHGVPAGVELTLGWSLLADGALHETILAPSLVVDADGEEHIVDPVRVRVRARAPFAVRPAAFAYHVDAYALASPGSAPQGEPAVPEVCEELAGIVLPFLPETHVQEEAFYFELRLDDARAERVARAVRGGGGTLAGHLLALRSLLAEQETSGDPLVAAALDAVREALAELYDRLFVKLRIPGFAPAAADMEDGALRHALTSLFERLLTCRTGGEAYGGGPMARLERARVRALLAELTDAPYGAPAALRALVALVPSACEDEALLGAALGRYATTLDASLARCEGLTPDAYDAALAGERCEDLEDARAAFLAAMRSRIAIAGVA